MAEEEMDEEDQHINLAEKEDEDELNDWDEIEDQDQLAAGIRDHATNTQSHAENNSGRISSYATSGHQVSPGMSVGSLSSQSNRMQRNKSGGTGSVSRVGGFISNTLLKSAVNAQGVAS